MELSPGVMRAFNEIITMDYSLFFMGLLKTAFVIGSRARGAFSICFSILFSILPLFTLSDCVFVRLAAAPFVAGIKACREPQDLIGNLGGKEGEDREEEKKRDTHGLPRRCIDVFEHGALIFMPSKHTLKWFFNKRCTLMHSLSAQAIIMA